MSQFLNNQITIASYSFHQLLSEGMIDIYGYLESLRFRYHLNIADIWNGFLKEMDEDDIKKIKRGMDDRGITLANLCCDNVYPWAEDKEVLKMQNESAETMLRYAEILGAKTVRIDLGVKEDNVTEAQFDYIAEKFAIYAKRANDGGYIVGPENHWGASRRLSVQKKMFQEINSKGYGMLLHLGNWLLENGQTSDDNDIEAAPMTFHVHVDHPHSLVAMECLPAVRAAGYCGVLSVEHHNEINEYHATAEQLGNVLYAISRISI